MSRTLSPSLGCAYGLARVTRVWRMSRASVYRSRVETPPDAARRRPGPVGACPCAPARSRGSTGRWCSTRAGGSRIASRSATPSPRSAAVDASRCIPASGARWSRSSERRRRWGRWFARRVAGACGRRASSTGSPLCSPAWSLRAVRRIPAAAASLPPRRETRTRPAAACATFNCWSVTSRSRSPRAISMATRAGSGGWSRRSTVTRAAIKAPPPRH